MRAVVPRRRRPPIGARWSCDGRVARQDRWRTTPAPGGRDAVRARRKCGRAGRAAPVLQRTVDVPLCPSPRCSGSSAGSRSWRPGRLHGNSCRTTVHAAGRRAACGRGPAVAPGSALAGGASLRLAERTEMPWTGPPAWRSSPVARTSTVVVCVPVMRSKSSLGGHGARGRHAVRGRAARGSVSAAGARRSGRAQPRRRSDHRQGRRTDRRLDPSAGSNARPFVATDAAWQWVETVASAPDLNEQPVSALLAWVARETGRAIRYADSEVERRAATTILHGSVRHLAPLEALDVMLATTNLEYVSHPDGTLLIQAKPTRLNAKATRSCRPRGRGEVADRDGARHRGAPGTFTASGGAAPRRPGDLVDSADRRDRATGGRRGSRCSTAATWSAPGCSVHEEPQAADPRAVLAEIVGPFGLAVQKGPNGSLLLVRAPRDCVAPRQPAMHRRSASRSWRR